MRSDDWQPNQEISSTQERFTYSVSDAADKLAQFYNTVGTTKRLYVGCIGVPIQKSNTNRKSIMRFWESYQIFTAIMIVALLILVITEERKKTFDTPYTYLPARR
jgi:hypothetical protein